MVTLEGHESSVWSLAVLAGGRLASGSPDAKIKIWDLANDACLATLDVASTLDGHDASVLSLAMLEGGRLASASADQKIKIWDSALLDTLR